MIYTMFRLLGAHMVRTNFQEQLRPLIELQNIASDINTIQEVKSINFIRH